MAERIVDVKLKTASDTQSNWESKNTTLLDGELAYDKTKKNLKIGDGITAWNNLPYLIVETPIIEISGITQELLTNGSKMGAFTSEQVAQIVKAKGFIVSDTAVGRNYYFKIQLSASGGVYVLSCESNTDVNSNDLILCLINGTNWMAQIQLGKRFTEAIYNELKASGEGLKIVDFPTEIDLSASFLEGQTTNGQALVNADVIKIGEDLLYKTISGQGYAEFSSVNKNVDEDAVHYKTLYIEDGGWYNYAYKWHNLDESALIEPIKIEGTISGWETEDFTLTNVLLEPTDYQKFLQNKTAPIMIEDKVFQLAQFYFDEEAQGYYNYYTRITKNYIYTIIIGWYVDEIWIDDAYSEAIGSSGGSSGGSSDGVKIIELSIDRSQLNGTLNPEQFNIFYLNEKENVAFKVYNDDYGYTFYLTYSHATDDNGYVYACTTADEAHTLTLYDDQYSYYFSTINNEYVESNWQPIEFSQADAITGWCEHFDCYNLEISNAKFQEFIQRKFAPIKINNIPFEVYSFDEYQNGDYNVYYSCVVNNYVNRLGIVWRPYGSFVDDCDSTKVDENYSSGSSGGSSSRAIYTNNNIGTYSVTPTDDNGIATVNLLESNAYYRLDLSTLDYGQEQPAEIRIRFITNDIKGIFNFSQGLSLERLSFELQAGFFINHETLNLSPHVTIYGLFNYFGGQDNNVLMLEKSNAYLEDTIYNIEVDELGMCKVFANHKAMEI